MNINHQDILANIEYAEFVKADIDKDALTKDEYQKYINGKLPIEETPVVYVFICRYYLDDDNVVPLYIKFNFGHNRTEQNKIQECLFIKSIHLDETSCNNKVKYFKNTNPELKALQVSERNYEYINENDYLLKHPEELINNVKENEKHNIMQR